MWDAGVTNGLVNRRGNPKPQTLTLLQTAQSGFALPLNPIQYSTQPYREALPSTPSYRVCGLLCLCEGLKPSAAVLAGTGKQNPKCTVTIHKNSVIPSSLACSTQGLFESH